MNGLCAIAGHNWVVATGTLMKGTLNATGAPVEMTKRACDRIWCGEKDLAYFDTKSGNWIHTQYIYE